MFQDSTWGVVTEDGKPDGIFCLNCKYLRASFPLIPTDAEFLQCCTESAQMREMIDKNRSKLEEFLQGQPMNCPGFVQAHKGFSTDISSIWHVWTPKEFLFEFKEAADEKKHAHIEIDNEEGQKETVFITRGRRELRIQGVAGFTLKDDMLPIQLREQEPWELYQFYIEQGHC